MTSGKRYWCPGQQKSVVTPPPLRVTDFRQKERREARGSVHGRPIVGRGESRPVEADEWCAFSCADSENGNAHWLRDTRRCAKFSREEVKRLGTKA